MELEHKTITSSGGVQPTDEEGVVEALVSVTGIKDNVGDIIEPGAYSDTLKKIKPKGAWAHEWNTPVSKVREIKELLPGDSALPSNLADGTPWPSEAGALYVKAEFNLNTSAGRDAYENVKFFGEDCEWSIGYRVPKGGAVKDAKTGIRHIKNLNLYEFSPVLFGAASNARSLPLATSVKDLFQSDDEFKGMVLDWVKEEQKAEEEKDLDDEGVSDEELEASVKSIEEEEETKSEERSESRMVELNPVVIDNLKRLHDEIEAVLGDVLKISEKSVDAVEIESKTVEEALDDLTNSDVTFNQKFLFDVILFERAKEDEKKDSAIALIDSIEDELDAADAKSEVLLKTLAKAIGDSFSVGEIVTMDGDHTGDVLPVTAAVDESKNDGGNEVVDNNKISISADEWKNLLG